MENDKKRPCPTGPGWWYRGGEIVQVINWPTIDGRRFLYYKEAGVDGMEDVEDDGRWIGPVPMPGQIRECGTCAYDVIVQGQNPAKGANHQHPFDTEKWYWFTWDRNTGEMTPRDTDEPEEETQ